MLASYGILIFAGICVVLVVWVHFQVTMRPSRIFPTGRDSATLDRPLMARRHGREPDDAELREFGAHTSLRSYRIAGLSLPDYLPLPSGPRQGELTLTDAKAPQVLALTAVFREPCAGTKLRELLLGAGMELARDGLYKRWHEPERKVLYYVANSTRGDGRFDRDGRLLARIRQATFFTRLPLPVNELHVFNEMWRTAEEVCDRLGGELQDDRQESLTGSRSEAMLAEAEAFAALRTNPPQVLAP